MRCVVTGGFGFIGSHLVDALLRRTDVEVIVIDNLQRGHRANLTAHDGDPRLRRICGDVRETEQLVSATAGASVVFHLAAQANVMGAISDPRYSFETNVAGTYNVLETSLRAGVRRVVFASSREVYGDPTTLPVDEARRCAPRNTYGASKVAAEAYCSTFESVFGLSTAVLRFANVYGPRDHGRVIPLWIERALAGAPLDLYGGDQLIDFVPVNLAVEALLRAAEVDMVCGPVNVASGVGTPLRTLARRIIKVADSGSRLRILPARGAEVRRFVADVSRMRSELGLVPPTDPLEQLDDQIVSCANPVL